MGELEVLIGELLAVDALAARALYVLSVEMLKLVCGLRSLPYITTGEVTTLKHELRDHAVEFGARVAEALLAGAEGAEVLDGLGDDIVEELEVDAAGAL